MTDDEMAETIMRELPAAYEIMPPDILCGYISVYRNDKRRKETTLKEIKTVLDWERTVPYRPYAIADCLTTQPPRRAEFESMYQCGPVGTANEHRVVVLERIGAMLPRAFCAAVTGDGNASRGRGLGYVRWPNGTRDISSYTSTNHVRRTARAGESA